MNRSRPASTETQQQSKQKQPRLTDLAIITGFSGAGKSTAMNVFEDAGYFCVDNLPPEMIRSLAELFMHEGSKVERAAIVCDVRGGEYFEPLITVLADLRKAGISVRLVFLEADEQTLLTRYKETRRRHPLSPEGSVTSGVLAEQELLEGLKSQADHIIDTTGMTTANARRKIAKEVLPSPQAGRLAVTFSSFGFKHGPPRDADLVFDVRFLPNPHYEAALRDLTGFDAPVVEYINREGELDEFYRYLTPMLDYLLPRYVAEGKAHLNVAIGCTGGRHRSVTVVEYLKERFADDESHYAVEVVHRDLDRLPRV